MRLHPPPSLQLLLLPGPLMGSLTQRMLGWSAMVLAVPQGPGPRASPAGRGRALTGWDQTRVKWVRKRRAAEHPADAEQLIPSRQLGMLTLQLTIARHPQVRSAALPVMPGPAAGTNSALRNMLARSLLRRAQSPSWGVRARGGLGG